MSQTYTTSGEWETFSCAFEQFCDMVEHVRSEASRQLAHRHVEQFLEAEGRELLRRLLQGHRDDRAANEIVWESLEGHDGITRTHHRPGCATHLATLCGDVVVKRHA
jgi:hypothetical protein